MKAIILAAGSGTRLNKYTKNLPKGMLNVFGKTIIERQIDLFIKADIKDIIIITGYASDKINYKGIKYYHNKNYDKTNMVESLFCAQKEFTDNIIISYADIVYTEKVLKSVQNNKHDIVVAVDIDWKKYWKLRYGKINFDTESLKFNADNQTIKELGTPDVHSSQIDARYVGLLKFSKKGLEILKYFYDLNKTKYWDKPWQKSGKTFQNAYMTDIIQELIDRDNKVYAHKISGGWLEFDTNEDYELIQNNKKLWSKIK